MATPTELSKDYLVSIVRTIQEILWVEDDDHGRVWSPAKEWHSAADCIERVAAVLIAYGLRPDAPARLQEHDDYRTSN